MNRNPWLKLSGVALGALILIIALLWGIGQFNSYNNYYRNGYSQNGMYIQGQFNGGMMQGNMNGQANMGMGMMDKNMDMMKDMMNMGM